MVQPKPDAWAELYESIADNTERLTEEIDRLSADLRDTNTLSTANARMLKQMNELAAEFGQRSREIAASVELAQTIADAAGQNAAASLVNNVEHAGSRLGMQLAAATRSVDETVGDLRRASRFTRAWCITCALLSLVGMALGAYGMHRIQQPDPATDQELHLRAQGMMLNYMLANASKKELAVLKTAYERESKKLASKSGASPQQR